MSKVDSSAMHIYQDGTVETAATLTQNIELLRVAGNDNYDRLIKQFQILHSDGTVIATQSLDTVINYLKFKEGAGITLSLDAATATLMITVDVNYIATKQSLVTHTTSADHDPRYYTKAQTDANITNAALGSPPPNSLNGSILLDGTVTTAKLVDGSVTPVKLSFDPATQSELDVVSADVRKIRLRSIFN